MRNRLALTLCLAAAMVSLSPAGALADAAPAGNLEGGVVGAAPSPEPSPQGSPSAAGGNFDLYGAGYGHGVGLSQWGAYGLAARGWSHRRILTHFYRGASVGQAPNPPAVIRVGLVWDRACCTLTAVGGPVKLRFGSHTNRTKFKIPNGYTWRIRPDSGKFKLINAKGHVVAKMGGPNWSLFAVYEGAGSRVRIAEFGHSLNHGYLEMNVYRPCSSCGWLLRAVGVMSPQQYLYGLAEVPSSWPMQSLQAQADAGRSYAFNVIAAQGQHRTVHGRCNCGIYANTIDQAYWGYDKEADGAGWPNAVRATNNEVVLYGGHAITANYTASSGGYTEDNDEVWRGTNPIPYLRGVCDPGDYVASNPSRTWNVSFSASQVSAALRRYGYDVGTVTGVASVRRTSKSGRIISITITGTGGSDGRRVTIAGGTFKGILGLRDDKVWVNHNRNVVGEIRRKYDALMCAPGLPLTRRMWVPGGKVQRFANGAMYLRGGDGRAFWSHGRVYAKYRDTGGPRGVLGLPRSGIQELRRPSGCHADRACLREGFDHGRIYYKAGVGAHELHGRVLAFYLTKDGAEGSLGFPTSDVRKRDGTASATFEHGKITCSSGGSCSRS